MSTWNSLCRIWYNIIDDTLCLLKKHRSFVSVLLVFQVRRQFSFSIYVNVIFISNLLVTFRTVQQSCSQTYYSLCWYFRLYTFPSHGKNPCPSINRMSFLYSFYLLLNAFVCDRTCNINRGASKKNMFSDRNFATIWKRVRLKDVNEDRTKKDSNNLCKFCPNAQNLHK